MDRIEVGQRKGDKIKQNKAGGGSSGNEIARLLSERERGKLLLAGDDEDANGQRRTLHTLNRQRRATDSEWRRVLPRSKCARGLCTAEAETEVRTLKRELLQQKRP